MSYGAVSFFTDAFCSNSKKVNVISINDFYNFTYFL